MDEGLDAVERPEVATDGDCTRSSKKLNNLSMVLASIGVLEEPGDADWDTFGVDDGTDPKYLFRRSWV